MPRKRVLITLPPDAYRRLVEVAEQEERVVDQQASLLLKRLRGPADSRRVVPCSGETVRAHPPLLPETVDGSLPS